MTLPIVDTENNPYIVIAGLYNFVMVEIRKRCINDKKEIMARHVVRVLKLVVWKKTAKRVKTLTGSCDGSNWKGDARRMDGIARENLNNIYVERVHGHISNHITVTQAEPST